MFRLSSFLTGVAFGALLLYAAMNFHVIRASDGFHLVPKQPARFSETFVDTRSFGLADWAGHPQLATALVQANKQHLLGDSAAGAVHQSMNKLIPNWSK